MIQISLSGMFDCLAVNTVVRFLDVVMRISPVLIYNIVDVHCKMVNILQTCTLSVDESVSHTCYTIHAVQDSRRPSNRLICHSQLNTVRHTVCIEPNWSDCSFDQGSERSVSLSILCQRLNKTYTCRALKWNNFVNKS
jgi:hypothetical protein